MEEDGVQAKGSDLITIYLVQKRPIAEQDGHTDKKLKRTSTEYEVEGELPLGEIKAESSKLRQCSKYFELCMSGRWSTMQEFHLDVQTEVLYYHDCFSRMKFLLKPIPSVSYCIELLKVASQIAYQEAVEIGEKYLSATPWSVEEEKLIRNSGHLSLASIQGALRGRLDALPLEEEERQNELSHSAARTLKQYLRHSLPKETFCRCRCQSSRHKFEGAFHTICSEPRVCSNVLQYALQLVRKESKKLLASIKRKFEERPASDGVHRDVTNFCWLFKIARKAYAAQELVELLSKDKFVSQYLYDASFHLEILLPMWTQKKMARVVHSVMQDVLEGRLFLKTSQRITLFKEWCWLLQVIYLDRDGAQVAEFVARFIASFPQRQQEEIWRTTALQCGHGPSSEAHTIWITNLVTQKTSHQHELAVSQDEENESAELGS